MRASLLAPLRFFVPVVFILGVWASIISCQWHNHQLRFWALILFLCLWYQSFTRLTHILEFLFSSMKRIAWCFPLTTESMESGIFNCAWERPSLKWFPALLTTPLVPPQPEDHLCVALKIFRAWPSQWWRRQYCIPTDVHRHETRESADLAWEKAFKKWSNCPLPNYPRQFFLVTLSWSIYSHS